MWSIGRSRKYANVNIIREQQGASWLKGVRQVGVRQVVVRQAGISLLKHANITKLCMPNQKIGDTPLNNV